MCGETCMIRDVCGKQKTLKKCIPVTLGHMRVKQQTFMTESAKIDHVVQKNLRFFVFAIS